MVVELPLDIEVICGYVELAVVNQSKQKSLSGGELVGGIAFSIKYVNTP